MSAVKDVFRFLRALYALASTSITAGGAGDNTAINGTSFQISTLTRRPTSCMFAVPCKATLGANATLTVALKIQESLDGSTWTDVVSNTTALVLTDSGSGSTLTGIATLGCDCIRKNATYLRCVCTPDLSAANTDTAVIGAGTVVFGGNDVSP